jgi:hypothetical protein
MVFVNPELREIGRMQMPEDINGMAWVSPEWKTVYYGKADGFYTMDLQTGISRLLREHPSQNNQVTGLFAQGTVLRCTEENEQGEKRTLLIDATTGAVLDEDNGYDTLMEWEQNYFFQRYEGAVLRLHFGMTDGTCYSLEQIASLLEISKERVRQIEKQAIGKLQKMGSTMGLEDFLT